MGVMLVKLLSGIKVVDFSKWLPGQYCGMLMGDYGADIIKVEDLAGDATRRFWPAKAPGMSYWHMMLNRNKRGVALNLRREGGREALLKLLSEADVFLEGFRPGYLARYGLDYATVHELNPRLVYCSITGFGQNCHKPAHDLNVIGLAGLNSLDDTGNACVSEVQVSALGSALNALSGIAMALLARERMGEGQWLDVNLYATALSLQVTNISSLWGCAETGEQPFGRIAHYYNIYKTKDGRFLTVGTIEPKFWQRFCDLLGCPELEQRQFDFAHGEELQKLVGARIAEKTQAEWLELIGGAEFCVTPVCSLDEALRSELTEQERIVQEADTDLGRLRYIGGPVKFSAAASEQRFRAPYLGEHTQEVLAELGYTAERIAALRDEGAI
jgi:crotonobetainyl-CoA:carnitine CoA-transferase CaiB-like acyl-CoA transferase